MFENLNIWEVGVLVLLALFIFGPERLPKAVSDGLRTLRRLREMARNATSDLSRELGTEVTIEDLHPKTFLRKHLLSEEEEQNLRRPLDQAYHDIRQIAADTNSTARPEAGPPQLPPSPRSYERGDYEPARYDSGPSVAGPSTPGAAAAAPSTPGTAYPPARPYDSDAT